MAILDQAGENGEINDSVDMGLMLEYQDSVWLASKSEGNFRGETVYDYMTEDAHLGTVKFQYRTGRSRQDTIMKVDRYNTKEYYMYYVVVFVGMGTRLKNNAITILKKVGE